jgi:hypothetical protein
MNLTTFLLTSEPYLNKCEEQYRNIITVNILPQGPLKRYVIGIRTPRLSHFDCYGRDKCALALLSFRSGRLMSDDEIPNLFSFLLENGYTIDTNLTNMMNNGSVKLNNKTVICFVTYNKN